MKPPSVGSVQTTAAAERRPGEGPLRLCESGLGDGAGL